MASTMLGGWLWFNVVEPVDMGHGERISLQQFPQK